MKTIKNCFIAICMLLMLPAMAQEKNKQVVKSSTTKTFNFEKDGVTIPYRITVFKTKENKVTLDPSDADKINQDRTDKVENVTQLILVDNDVYDDYDRYIVLRYQKDPNDSFELEPTKRGFKVIVDNHFVEYIYGEGIYFVNNADRDYFVVEEFDAI